MRELRGRDWNILHPCVNVCPLLSGSPVLWLIDSLKLALLLLLKVLRVISSWSGERRIAATANTLDCHGSDDAARTNANEI